MSSRTAAVAALAPLLALATAPAAQADPVARAAHVSARPSTAALQVALKAVNLYSGAVDGIRGPMTRRALLRFQRRQGLAVDGIAGPQTRRALGRRGRPRLGSRVMRRGHRGWDVAALQFLLGRGGFSPGGIDGGFGTMTGSAVRRFQASAGLPVDELVGSATLRALRRGSTGTGTPIGPVRFLRPVRAPITDGFGWRWGRMHHGIDFPAPSGTPVGAAGRGVVRFAGWNRGGYGYLVVIGHRLGFESWYAHLSRIVALPGQPVVGGTRIGYVGSTGHSTGPHLHFEVRLNGTPIDPAPYLLSSYAARLPRRLAGPLECVDGPPRARAGSRPRTARMALPTCPRR
jgi:peptidoglycan hydrolase-like protein with peptidoglycan-binding domain